MVFHEVPYLIQSTIRIVSHGHVAMIHTESEDRDKEFALLNVPENLFTITSSQSSPRAVSSVHIDVEQ